MSVFPKSFEEPCNKHTRTTIWPWLLIVFILLMIASCGTLTEEQKLETEWEKGIDKENWSLCSRMVDGTIHLNHVHQKHMKSRPVDIRDDLWRNNCKMVLGESWAEYHYGE